MSINKNYKYENKSNKENYEILLEDIKEVLNKKI